MFFNPAIDLGFLSNGVDHSQTDHHQEGKCDPVVKTRDYMVQCIAGKPTQEIGMIAWNAPKKSAMRSPCLITRSWSDKPLLTETAEASMARLSAIRRVVTRSTS